MSFLFTPEEVFGKLQSKTVNQFYNAVNGVIEKPKPRETTMAVSGFIMNYKTLPAPFTGMINRFVNYQTNMNGSSVPPLGSSGRGGSWGRDNVIIFD